MKKPSRHLYSLCILISILGVQRLYAQTDLLGQYPDLLGYYNASAIGLEDELTIRAVHNRQLEGIEGSAKTFALIADMPLRLLERRHAVGLQMHNTTLGLFKDTALGARYAFRLSLGKAGVLQVGVGAKLTTSLFEGSKIFIPSGIEGASPSDTSLPTADVSGRGIDLQLGLYYRYKRLDIGLGTNNILASRILLDNKYIREQVRTYNMFARYRLGKTGASLQWEPSMLLEVNDDLMYRLDLRLAAWWRERFVLAAVYRPTRAVGVNLGLRIGKAFIGYQFEYPTSELHTGAWGNHELMVSYRMPIDLGERKNNKYKSIRLL